MGKTMVASKVTCLRFQALSWYAQDVEDDIERINKYHIKIFGCDAKGETVGITVLDFMPYFYVKPNFRLLDTNVKRFTDWLIPQLHKGRAIIPRITIVTKKEFWGFTNFEDFAYLKLAFPSLEAMRRTQRLLSKPCEIQGIQTGMQSSKQKQSFKLYESNIDPYIRFIHERNIQPCGWIKAKGILRNAEKLQSICTYDQECKWNEIHPYSCETTAPFQIAAFDIECTSSSGDFPVAQKNMKSVVSQLYDAYYSRFTKSGDYDRKQAVTRGLWYVLGDLEEFEHSDIMSRVEFKNGARCPKESIHEVVDDITTLLSGNFTKAKLAKESIVAKICHVLKKNIPLFDIGIKGDAIIQIGTTIHRYGDRECSTKHILTLGTCDEIEGVTVKACETEEELLIEWVNFIQDMDPDIITGYNIFGFDMSYMYDRAKELRIESTFMKLSRIQGKTCAFKEHKLSSSALGDNILKFVDMEGRVLVDLMKVVMRDHKLDSFKLDNVAHHFMGMNKNDVSPQDIFKLQRGGSQDRAVVAKYCIQDCSLCNHLMMKLEIIANNMGMSNVCLVPLSFIFMRGQGIKIFSLVLNQCMHEGYVMPVLDRQFSVADYIYEDMICSDTGLLERVKTEVKNMTKQCSLDTRLHSYSNDELAVSFIRAAYEKLGENEKPIFCKKQYVNNVLKLQDIINVIKENEETEVDDDSYEGAIVLEPKEGIYIDDPVSVLDYASLYPSSMISENLSHDCIVLDPKYDNLPGVDYLDISYDIYTGVGDKKQKIGQRDCRFVQLQDNQKGIIPRILMKLLQARKSTRKKIGLQLYNEQTGFYNDKKREFTTETGEVVHVPDNQVASVRMYYNEFQMAVLDGLQSAYKVTANSLYGQIGAKTSPVYLKDIAACTTATGRKMITSLKAFLETNYNANIVYGDTDSIFAIFPNTQTLENGEVKKLTGKDAITASIKTAVEASKEFKQFIKPPHDAEYEKTFWPFILLSKKRYVGNMYETDNKKFKQKSMGIVLKRRDNANIVKRVYGGIIDIILNSHNIQASVEFMNTCLTELIMGKCPMTDLIVTKCLRGDYKDPTRIAHKVLAERMGERDPGNKPQINERIPYAYVKVDLQNEDKKLKVLQGERIEHPDYIKKNNLTLDYNFYITNQIMKPVLQLYGIIIERIGGFSKPDGYYDTIRANMLKDLTETDVKDKIITLREADAKEILFDPFLKQIDQNWKPKRVNASVKKYYVAHLPPVEVVKKPRRSTKSSSTCTEDADSTEVIKKLAVRRVKKIDVQVVDGQVQLEEKPKRVRAKKIVLEVDEHHDGQVKEKPKRVRISKKVEVENDNAQPVHIPVINPLSITSSADLLNILNVKKVRKPRAKKLNDT